MAARAAPERAAPADRRLPRLPDELREPWPATATTISKAQAGRGLRGIEPGMPTPAGTGLSRRAFLARSSGLALSVFGGDAAVAAARSRRASRPRSPARPSPVLVSIFLSGGLDSLSVLAPIGDPRYAALRPDLALTPSGDAADVFTEDDRLHWHPSAGAAARPAPRREGLRDAGHRLHRSQPVALHLAPLLGGRRGQPVRAHRLARALPRQARSGRQPAAGPLARLEPRARAGRGRQAGRRRLARPSTSRSARATSGTPRSGPAWSRR